MNLVVFEYAIDHLLKICRIIKMTNGHGLLIGLGGSGRQSLSCLGAFVRETKVFSIEMSKSYERENWVNDMQKMMIYAGVENKESLLMLNDNQVKASYVLEDINNLLNSGNIPNLFTSEDFIPHIDNIRQLAKKLNRPELSESGSNSQLYDFLIE